MSSKTKASAAKEEEAKPVRVPKLRFPEFRGAWELETLETLGYFTGGGTPSKDNAAYWTGEIPWISSSDLTEDSISKIDVSRFITKQAVQESATKLVPARSILLISRVGVGKLAVSTFPLCTSQDFTNFTPTVADPLFLAYLLKSQKQTLLSFNQGTSIKGFTKDNIASLRLGFPTIAEQRKIAECLSSVDELMAAQARKVEALKTHKKGLMQQLFPTEGETQPRLRFPEFQNAGEWEDTRLGRLGELVSGLTFSPDDVRESGLLVLRSSNVQNGEIALDDCVYVDPSIKGANLSQPNDILICVRNGSKALIGKCALIPDGMPLCTHGAFMTVFRAKSPSFVFQLFQTDRYQKQVAGDLGATINSINGSQLLKYEFFVPKPPEQQRIASCLSSLDALITAETQKLEALKTHKKGLMQQLFSTLNEPEA